MSGDTTGKTSKVRPRTDWRRLSEMTDEEVHAAVVADPEINPTDEEFWRASRLVVPKSKPQKASGMPARVYKQRQQDVFDYIEARKWYRQRVEQGKATDDDLKKLEHCRDLAVEARRSGVTAPEFE